LFLKTPYLWGVLLPRTNCNFNKMSRCCLSNAIGCLLLLLLLSSDLIAQKDQFPFPAFEKITTRQGLSDNAVYRMTQDKMGFLWFLTSNGLNRYDGYTFKIYDYNPLDSNSISSNLFYSLKQDERGLLWMNSESRGIYSFNPLTGLYHHYHNKPKDKNSLASDQTQDLVIDRKGNVWVATMSGLDKLDAATNSFTHYVHSDNDKSGISHNMMYSLCIDEDDNLWIVTGTPGIDYFNTQTGKLIRHFDFGSSDNPGEDWSSAGHSYEVNTGKNGNVWIGSKNHGFYGYNTRTGRIINFQHHKDDPYSVSDNGVYKIREDHAGNLWLATDAGMIDFYDKASGKFYHRPVPAIDQLDIMEDASYKVWIASMNGIYSCDTRFKKINTIQQDLDNSSSNDYSPWNFLRTRKGVFYISYKGMQIFDTLTKKLTPFIITENGKNIFENNITWQIYEDSKGHVWFATIRGLVFYNPGTKQHQFYKHDEKDSTSPSAIPCTWIIEDRKGRYWVTTWGGGLDAFDQATGKFRAFKVNESANSPSSDNLSGIFEDSRGKLYIGTGGGINVFDPDNETFKVYLHNVRDSASPICDNASQYRESKSGIIWFCTGGGGINAFDPRTEEFRAFTVKDGLSSNRVRSITEDNFGKYWLGTDKGISYFTPPENPFDPKSKLQFRNYDINDGLPDNSMNLFAAYKDVGGKIFFGSSSVFYLDPADLRDNDYAPPVYITDLKLFNKSIHPFDADSILKSRIEITKEIILPYDKNDISFEFAALNYFHPEKNQYQYKLENYNEEWIVTDAAKRYANYTNLNPGKYIFRVKASNNDGLWSPHEASIVVIITPPFWQTWWFRTLVVLAVIAVAYGVYRYRMQQVLRLQNIRNKIASDLHDDIGSTLNSISVYSQVAKNDADKRDFSLNMIGESSRKVIDAMSDIVWTINPDNDSFENIILRMRSLAYNLLRAKNIEFIFKADESLNKMQLSLEKRRNFYLIFKESLNNLIKYSQAKRVQISLIHHGSTITLVIRDDGMGFDATKKYNGNGLTNIRKRAKEMDAQLNIESGEGIGTSTQLIFKS
jgi:ligand-binding sensor domain-containing protein/two-component sensor histidine kinase